MKNLHIATNNQKKVVIKSEDERLVYGEAYVPYHVDSQGEAMTTEEIKKMAHNFLASGRINKIDTNHNYIENGCLVVESFVARKNDPDEFVEGAWVLGVKVTPDELWEGIKKGEFNGFSIGGKAVNNPTRAVVKVARRMVGETEDSLNTNIIPTHSHKVDLAMDIDGNILNGVTEEKLGHTHKVLKSSATEKTVEHNHRLILVNNNE